jgi:HSP20 family protein
MELTKWDRPAPVDLWDAFEGLRGEMDRALDSLKVPDGSGIFDRSVAPAIDLIEREDDFLVVADLPGLRREEIDLTLAGTLLSIKGEKREERDNGKRTFLRREHWAGSFRRTINLPGSIDPDKVEAELKDGVLSIRIVKRDEAKTRTISVSVK